MGPRTVPCLTRLNISNNCVFPKSVPTVISAFLFDREIKFVENRKAENILHGPQTQSLDL